MDKENLKIQLGIIGMGRMGITHYSIINSHPNVEITAIADTSKLVTRLLNKYTKAIIYKKFEDMLNSDEVNAILVCTPPHLHYKIIKIAASKGIHVFCEKPFTTNILEGKELAELYNSKGLVNQVGYVNRHNDVFIKTKSFIEEGLIGNVMRFKSEMFSCTVLKQNNSEGWRSNTSTGGGALFEMGAHGIDLVNYLIGKPDKVKEASLNKIYSKNVEDSVSATFLYRDGKSGTLYVNWSDARYRKPTNKIEIFGSKGKILVDQHSLKIFLDKENKDYDLTNGWNTLYITDIFKPVQFYLRGNEFTRQLYEFVDIILEKNVKNKCSFNDGTLTLEVIDQIIKNSNLVN